MLVRYRALAASLLALCLTACGGGGSDGGGATASNPGGNWLTIKQSTPGVTQYEGESVPVSFIATASRTFAAPFNVAIVDAQGIIDGSVAFGAISETSFQATVRTATTLTAGSHSTTLEVRVCEDSPLTCAKPFPGSPWRVALNVQVRPRAEAAGHLTLSTPSVNVTTYPGDTASFKVEAQLNKELLGRRVNMGVFDPSALIVPPPDQWTSAADGHYAFEISTATANNLAVGTYQTTLQLRLCEDDIRVCKLPVAGSPWAIPLTLAVKPAINLTALAPIAGLSSWSTYQGGAAHTGFANASFDPAAFSPRWRVAGSDSYGQRYASLAVDSGRAFFVRRTGADNWQLVAVSEDTGEIAWKVELGDLSQVSPPAAANGRVYIASGGHQDSFMWVFDQSDGAMLKKLPMSSQWPSYSAPTILGTDVYAINGYYGGVSKYSDLAGQFSWNIGLKADDGWSPATDGRLAYVYNTPENRLYALNATDGSTAYVIGNEYPFSTYFTANPVMLTGTGQAIVAAGQLMAFDLTTHTRKWILNTSTYGKAALGNGTVYAFGPNGHMLEARAVETGDLAWSTADLGNIFSEVVVTRNLAFVSSESSTKAIDLTTHAVVWTFPRGGTLAISQRGVLYIRTGSGELSAVNLR